MRESGKKTQEFVYSDFCAVNLRFFHFPFLLSLFTLGSPEWT